MACSWLSIWGDKQSNQLESTAFVASCYPILATQASGTSPLQVPSLEDSLHAMTLDLNQELGDAARWQAAADHKEGTSCHPAGLPALLPAPPGLTTLCPVLWWLAVVAASLYLSCCGCMRKLTCCLSGL